MTEEHKAQAGQLILVEEESGRLDVFLSDYFGITRSQIKRLFNLGGVTVNGEQVKAGYDIKKGDRILADTAMLNDTGDVLPQDIPLDIVYEDDVLAVINKPQGMVVHPAPGVNSGTLVNALLFHMSKLSPVGQAEARPGIVHRLDKDTSGLLVVAKTAAAHYSLASQIAQKTASRQYLALLEGVVKADSGVIDKNIIRSPYDRKTFTATDSGGKTAITEFKVEQRFSLRTLVRFILRTGRTHQIRVHAKFMGHPVVGDKVYGYKRQEYNTNGQLLHACLLEFDHPQTGKRMRFEAPLPDYFSDILAKQR